MLLCIVNGNTPENYTWASERKEQLSCLNAIGEEHSHQRTEIIACILYVSGLVNLIIPSTLYPVTTLKKKKLCTMYVVRLHW